MRNLIAEPEICRNPTTPFLPPLRSHYKDIPPLLRGAEKIMVLLGMRYSRGPDGTRGFTIGRGKPLPGSEPVLLPRQPGGAGPASTRHGSQQQAVPGGAGPASARHSSQQQAVPGVAGLPPPPAAQQKSAPPPAAAAQQQKGAQSSKAQQLAQQLAPSADPSAQGAKSWACIAAPTTPGPGIFDDADEPLPAGLPPPRSPGGGAATAAAGSAPATTPPSVSPLLPPPGLSASPPGLGLAMGVGGLPPPASLAPSAPVASMLATATTAGPPAVAPSLSALGAPPSLGAALPHSPSSSLKAILGIADGAGADTGAGSAGLGLFGGAPPPGQGGHVRDAAALATPPSAPPPPRGRSHGLGGILLFDEDGSKEEEVAAAVDAHGFGARGSRLAAWCGSAAEEAPETPTAALLSSPLPPPPAMLAARPYAADAYALPSLAPLGDSLHHQAAPLSGTSVGTHPQPPSPSACCPPPPAFAYASSATPPHPSLGALSPALASDGGVGASRLTSWTSSQAQSLPHPTRPTLPAAAPPHGRPLLPSDGWSGMAPPPQQQQQKQQKQTQMEQFHAMAHAMLQPAPPQTSSLPPPPPVPEFSAGGASAWGASAASASPLRGPVASSPLGAGGASAPGGTVVHAQVAQLQQQSQHIMQQLMQQRHQLSAEQQMELDLKVQQWQYQQRLLQAQQLPTASLPPSAQQLPPGPPLDASPAARPQQVRHPTRPTHHPPTLRAWLPWRGRLATPHLFAWSPPPAPSPPSLYPHFLVPPFPSSPPSLLLAPTLEDGRALGTTANAPSRVHTLHRPRCRCRRGSRPSI